MTSWQLGHATERKQNLTSLSTVEADSWKHHEGVDELG